MSFYCPEAQCFGDLQWYWIELWPSAGKYMVFSGAEGKYMDFSTQSKADE